MKINKITNVSIELSEKQLKKFNDWIQTFGELPNIGATGGHFGLSIIFTSLGTIVKGVSWNDKEIELTQYEDF